MTPYQPTAETGVHRTAKLLIVIATAISLIAVIACSGDEPPPTDRPDRSQPQVEKTIEAMDAEIAALQTEIAESQGTPRVERPTRSTQPTPRKSSPTPKPTETPTPIVIARPTGPGICGRSPEIQGAIIHYLNVNLCQAITTPELFRLTNLEVGMVTARAGDFAGLVNVKELNINANDIDPGAFIGLDSLTKMTLTMPAQGTISQEAFNGLPNLTEINITAHHSLKIETSSIAGMPSLETLEIDMPSPGKVLPGALQNLPELETLEIKWRSAREEGPAVNTLGKMEPLPSLEQLSLTFVNDYSDRGNLPPIGPNTLTPFPNLKYLNIYGSGDNRITLNAGSFTNNPNLTEIAISGRITNARNAFKSLHKLEELRISTPDGAEEIELALSPNSPLMKDILNRDKEPRGYKVIPPGAD